MVDRRLLPIARVVFEEVNPRFVDTVGRLSEWTGEFSASTVGAGLPSGPPSSAPASEDEAQLSKIEADAVRPDRARRKLARLDQLMTRATRELLDVLTDVVDTREVQRSTSRKPAARVAYLVWLVARLERESLGQGAGPALERARLAVFEVGDILETYRPVAPVLVAGCRACESAGLRGEIDDRYRGLGLCRWCGDWKRDRGAVPDPEILRMRSRGIRITPAREAEAIAASRRRRRLRNRARA